MEMQQERSRAWDEVDEFLLSGPSVQQIVDFHPSDAIQARARLLLDRNREGNLSETERLELDDFQALENFMRRLKIKALVKLRT
jgi:hypothetical protein